MQRREVSKSKDVPSSHSQDSQEATRFTNFYHPEASQSGHQEASSSSQREALLRAQRLFEPGASRPSQSENTRPAERRIPPVTDFRTEAQKKADTEANLRRANQMFDLPEDINTAGYMLGVIERDRGGSPRTQ